jgi:hypothetical protein
MSWIKNKCFEDLTSHWIRSLKIQNIELQNKQFRPQKHSNNCIKIIS